MLLNTINVESMLKILLILGNRGRQKNVIGRSHSMGELVVRKCCTSLLCYLDNRSAVGVTANNTLRLHHNARKLAFGEKTRMRRVLCRDGENVKYS